MTSENASLHPLPPTFLALLCCPVCEDRPPLRSVQEAGAEERLVCDRCGRVYPVRDGLPDLRPQDGISDAPAPARTDGGKG